MMRGPREYDQPWEWKKERISKAFAGESWVGEGSSMQGWAAPAQEEMEDWVLGMEVMSWAL